MLKNFNVKLLSKLFSLQLSNKIFIPGVFNCLTVSYQYHWIPNCKFLLLADQIMPSSFYTHHSQFGNSNCKDWPFHLRK